MRERESEKKKGRKKLTFFSLSLFSPPPPPPTNRVSKAMLESVVFAHQDESLWPLGDAQGLKKRFDDLFASTKYAKALDALRKLRVEKTAGSNV